MTTLRLQFLVRNQKKVLGARFSGQHGNEDGMMEFN